MKIIKTDALRKNHRALRVRDQDLSRSVGSRCWLRRRRSIGSGISLSELLLIGLGRRTILEIHHRIAPSFDELGAQDVNRPPGGSTEPVWQSDTQLAGAAILLLAKVGERRFVSCVR